MQIDCCRLSLYNGDPGDRRRYSNGCADRLLGERLVAVKKDIRGGNFTSVVEMGGFCGIFNVSARPLYGDSGWLWRRTYAVGFSRGHMKEYD